MTQKLVIEAEADAQDKIIHEIAEKMKKIDDDIVIHI